MKKIALSLLLVGIAAGAVILGTSAFFSDTETSTGNTFTAGAIDLKIDSNCTYNGLASEQCGSWELKDLNTQVGTETVTAPTVVSDKFFNFSDIKPGDFGENTISLHVFNNDAWVCAQVSNLVSADNDLTEPESETGDDAVSGELDDTMIWTIWKDDGVGGGIAGNNIQDGTEVTLASGHPVNGILPLYDSSTGPLTGDVTGYIGVKWELPEETGNEAQTDSLTGDISFYAVQSRHNDQFTCESLNPVFVLTDASEQNALNAVSQDKPWYTYEIDGLCIDFSLHNPTYSPAWFDTQRDGAAGTYYNGLSNITITQGPLAGTQVGNLYDDDITVPAHGTLDVTKCATSEIRFGIHYGAEQLWYLDWATFSAQ